MTRRSRGRCWEIETRGDSLFDRIANRPALLEAIRTGEVRTGALWAAAIAAWAGDTAYADRILAEHLARVTPGREHALTRRRMAIIAAGLGLASRARTSSARRWSRYG